METVKSNALYESLLARYGAVMRSDSVASVLGCHPSHVRIMCQKGEIPSVKVGCRWFVPTKKFSELLDPDSDVIQHVVEEVEK